MPPQSHGQRRRSSQRSQQRPARPAAARPVAPQPDSVEPTYSDIELPITDPADTTTPISPVTIVPTSSRPASTSNRPRRGTSTRTRSVPEPVDYTADYVAASRDMRWILIWAGLLFVAMFVLFALQLNGIIAL